MFNNGLGVYLYNWITFFSMFLANRFFFILTLFWDCIWLLRAGPLGLTPFLNIAQYLLYYTDVTLREECVEADIENNMANVYDTLSSPFTLKL